MRFLKNHRGFTLVEVVLALVLGTIFMTTSSSMILNNIDSYQFQTSRKAALSDVRYALNRISRELRYLETTDITNIFSVKIDFLDETGTATNFRLVTSSGNLSLYRGTLVLIDRISSFSIKYYDDQGIELVADPASIPSVRRIKVSIASEPVAQEGVITLTTTITPRDFLDYNNYRMVK